MKTQNLSFDITLQNTILQKFLRYNRLREAIDYFYESIVPQNQPIDVITERLIRQIAKVLDTTMPDLPRSSANVAKTLEKMNNEGKIVEKDLKSRHWRNKPK